MSDADRWQRFHPLTPLLKGGVATVAVIGWVVGQQVDRVFGAAREDPTRGNWGPAAALVGLVVVVVVIAAWATWRVSRFRLGDANLEVHTGLVFRQQRRVRYDRIQAVDVVRPLLARLVGLSEVRVESGGGSDSNVQLAFLTDATARGLRDELLTLAGHGDEAPAARGPEDGIPSREQAHGDTVLRIPNARLVQSALYSVEAVLVVLAVPTLALAVLLEWPAVLTAVGPVTLAVGARKVGQLVRWFNFHVTDSGESLRVRHGLTDLRTSSVPRHRIQAVQLTQGPTWRLPGWWRLDVNIAGVGGGEEGTATTVMPVGTFAEAERLLAILVPGVDRDIVAEAATSTGPGPSRRFVASPRRARRLDPVGWGRSGYAVTPRAVVTRAGAVVRRVQVVPHARIQSMTVSQGPWERRLDLAVVRLVSTVGAVSPLVEHLSTGDALTLFGEQTARSAAARTAVDPSEDRPEAPPARSPDGS